MECRKSLVQISGETYRTTFVFVAKSGILGSLILYIYCRFVLSEIYTFQNGHCDRNILCMSKRMFSGSKNTIKNISAAFIHDLWTMSK